VESRDRGQKGVREIVSTPWARRRMGTCPVESQENLLINGLQEFNPVVGNDEEGTVVTGIDQDVLRTLWKNGLQP